MSSTHARHCNAYSQCHLLPNVAGHGFLGVVDLDLLEICVLSGEACIAATAVQLWTTCFAVEELRSKGLLC